MLSSRKTALVILAITALVCSRAMFALFNDPEGPNLLIVMVMAAILYFLSLAAYIYNPLETGLKKLLLTIFVQVLLATGLYFLLS
jgi:hypothetical protein